MKRLFALTTVAFVAFSLTACGSDSDSTSDSDSVTTEADSGSDSSSSTASDSDSGSGTTSGPITGVQICERLTAEAVSAATGLDITETTPSDTATPYCGYKRDNDSGGTSEFSVAWMRPDDVRGATGSDAYDVVLSVNNGEGVESEELPVGDAAIRLSGETTHVGVVQLGDYVYMLVVAVDDLTTDRVNNLITEMATALG